MYIFVDETGDLGERGSRYFALVLVATEDAKGVERAVRRTLRRGVHPRRRVPELKGSLLPLQSLRYFYRQIAPVSFQLVAVVLDKTKVNLRDVDERLLYARMLCAGLRALPELSFPLHVFIDKRFSNPEFWEVRGYVKGYLAGQYGDPVQVELFQEDSRRRKEIQAADLFAWGISQKLAHSKEDWYSLFVDRMEVVEFLP